MAYISDLKHMQWLADRERLETSSTEDIERFYLQSSNVDRLHDEWIELYNEYLSKSYLVKYGDYLEADEYEELLEAHDISEGR